MPRRLGPAMLMAAAATPAVVVHDAAGAALALALAGPAGVILLSAPAAAGSLGAAWFLALVQEAEASAGRDAATHRAALDCGDAPGHALAALRAGARLLILDRAVPAFAAIAAAADEVGAEVWTARPPALDLARLDLRREFGRARLATWLRGDGGGGK